MPLHLRNELEQALLVFIFFFFGACIHTKINLQLVKLCLRAISFQLRHIILNVLLQLLERLVGIYFDFEIQLLGELKVDPDSEPQTSVF